MTTPIDTASVEIVPDFSDFPKRLRAGVDSALRGLVADIDRVFDQIERAAGRAGRDIGGEFQAGGEVAERALHEISTTASTQFAQVNAAAATSAAGIGSKFAGGAAIAKTALLALGAAAAVGLAAMAGFGLKAAADIEQVTIGLQALTGSAQTANQFLGELQQFAASTPFEFQGVADAARRILAFGNAVGIAKDEVIPTLTVIGDLVSVLGGTQESIDSVVRAFGQMSSKGKISQEELLQLAEALPGFNANAAIAAATGKSVADTLELITAGGVSAQVGIDALLKGMAQFPGAAGAMALQAQTLTGVFSTFKDTISIALSNAFTPVVPLVKDALADLTPILGSAISDLAPSLGGFIASVLPLIGTLAKALVPLLKPIIDALGPALERLGPALEPLGMALGELMVGLGPVLPILVEFLVALVQLAIPVLLLLAKILQLLTPVFNFMTDAIAELNKALRMINWAEVGQAIVDFAKAAGAEVGEFFTRIGLWFSELPGNVARGFAEARDAAVAKINELIQFVISLPGKILEAIGNLGSLLFNAGRDLIIGLWNGIASMGGWLWNKITSFVADKILNPVKDALGIASPSTVMADEVGRQIPAGIGQGVQAGLPDLQSMIQGIVPDGSAGSGGAGTTSFGGVTINLNFMGAVPTEAQARAVGAAAGDAAMKAMQQRSVGLAVRSARQ